MATTRLSDVIVPEVYESYGRINIMENDALFQSGVIATSPVLARIAREGGKTGSMPFWGDIDPTVEPNMSNDDPADIAVPMKIGTSTMNFRKSFMNQGWSSMDLVAELLGQDPMNRIKERTDTYWQRQIKRRFYATMKGVIADNIANDGGDMGVNVAGNAGAAGVVSVDSIVGAQYTLGDSTGQLPVTAVHSRVMQALVKQELIVYVPNSQGQLVIPTYMGSRVVMDDSLVWSGTGAEAHYLTLFFGTGAMGFANASGHVFAYGEGIPKTPVAVTRAEDTGNGGGQETLWERKTILMQPMGVDWVEGPSTGAGSLVEFSPTISDLQMASHWNRKIDRKAVPFAYLISRAQ